MLGFETNTPLADLEKSFQKLHRLPFTVDREETQRRAEAAKKLFGDILPVRIVGADYATGSGCGMAYKAVMLMGMENLYLAMCDQPENVHQLFDFIATECADFLSWLEKEGLITLNNGEYWVGSGSCGYTDELPRSAIKGDHVSAKDCWGFIEAQEAVGMSPEMYAEFIHPYQRRLGDRFGLVYYGCCEPVHDSFHVIKGLKSLRKITVSPWCDQKSAAESAGRLVVLSRKPHPMKLCSEAFDPKGFETHIRETLDITKNNFVELIFRDTNPLNGSMKERVATACKIVHKLIGRN